MIEKSFFGYEMSCDECGGAFPDVLDNFVELVAVSRNRGWRVFKEKGEWNHQCPACKNSVDFKVRKHFEHSFMG